MWVNEGLAVLNSVFPSMVLTINHGNGNEETARALHNLSLHNAKQNGRAAIIRTSDILGLWVDSNGSVSRR